MFNATPEEQRSAADDLNRWMSTGKLVAAVGKVFPLREAAAAHKLLEDNAIHSAGTLSGKVGDYDGRVTISAVPTRRQIY